MGSASTKLALVSVQESGVWENGSDVHPRSSTPAVQLTIMRRRRCSLGYWPVSLTILLREWRSCCSGGG